MVKILRRLLVATFIVLALLGIGAATYIHTERLSFDSIHHPTTNLNTGDLVIIKSANQTAKPVVIKSIPKVGYVLDAMRKPLGLAAIIYLPATLLVIYELKRLAKHYAYRPYKIMAPKKNNSWEYNRTIN